MQEFNTQPPSGTRDFLPEEAKNRERVFNLIKQVFETFGFLPIDTPAFERIENLMGKYGNEGEKLIFKILKRGERAASGEADLALRYDLTVPFARFFAQHQNQLPRPFRRYQIGPVWRADRPGKGRFREFYQCDIDIVGSSSLLADAEIILAFAKALSSLNLPRFIVRLNSRKVLAGLLEVYRVPERLKKGTLTVLDKLDKIGIVGVIKELEDLGLSRSSVSQISKDLSKKGAELKRKIKTSRIGREGLEEVEEVIALAAPSLQEEKIEFSPFLARGLDYYTGPIFEICLKESFGTSVAGGGRYDNLIGMFLGKQIPACGGSLGVDRIFSIFKKDFRNEVKVFGPQVFVTVWDHALRSEALHIATELRNEGIITEVFLGEGKISNQVRFASERGALYCLFYGPDEQARQEVTLKNLLTGEQKSVKRQQIIETLKSFIERW